MGKKREKKEDSEDNEKKGESRKRVRSESSGSESDIFSDVSEPKVCFYEPPGRGVSNRGYSYGAAPYSDEPVPFHPNREISHQNAEQFNYTIDPRNNEFFENAQHSSEHESDSQDQQNDPPYISDEDIQNSLNQPFGCYM